MCDTFVALPPFTADGSVILGKNSDREPNEAQVLTHRQRTRHGPGSMVQCTYVQIPQAKETYEVLLSRPFWMWGAEMGVNEHGVAIGNEAVFTREPYGHEPGLIGMDMLRLALERADDATTALEIIIELLAQYGQSGNCGFRRKTYYHNSFLIADRTQAWLLETAGREWAARRVASHWAISNGLTIDDTWDRASPSLVSHAIREGHCHSEGSFDMSRCYSDPLYTRFDGCRHRQQMAMSRMQSQTGAFDVRDAMGILRSHTPAREHPRGGFLMKSICAHASLGPTRQSQTVGSMVAHLTKKGAMIWVTGTAAPCTGLFKPVFLPGAFLPDTPLPTGTCDDRSLWWRHEHVHRAVMRDYPARLATYSSDRDRLEESFLERAYETLASESDHISERTSAITEAAFSESEQAMTAWRQRLRADPSRNRQPLPSRLAWRGFNRKARYPCA